MRSRKAGLPLATRVRKRDLCPYRYVSRMTRTESFISQKFFIVFLETTFLHVSCYPVLFIVSRKYISVFRSLELLPFDTQFWTRGFPLVMRSRKAGLPLGAVYKGRPPKSRIFKPPPLPLSGCVRISKTTPPPRTSASRFFIFHTFFNFYTFLFLLIKTKKFIAQFLFL